MSNMPKTKPFSFRIDTGLYAEIKRLSDDSNLKFSDVVEKSLHYFSYNQQVVLDYPSGNHALLFQLDDFNKDPKHSIRYLQEQGISALREFYWVASLIQKTYKNAGTNVTAEWVRRLVEVLQFLLNEEMKKNENMMSYVLSMNQERRAGSIDCKIADSLTFLRKKRTVSPVYATSIISSLIHILNEDFAISESNYVQLNTMLTPWCYWLATRAFNPKGQNPPIIDATPLLHATDSEKQESVHVQLGSVRSEGHLSRKGAGPFESAKRRFTSIFTISSGDARYAIVRCSAEEFYDLLMVIDQIQDRRHVAQKGSWEITRSDAASAILEKNGVEMALSNEALEDFMNSALALYKIGSVHNDIHLELVEHYGTV